MRQGVDLSNWNGLISDQQARALRAAGIDFAYVLLTDGASFKNPDAPQQVAALRRAGIVVGFYHFLRPVETNADQILDFVTYAHGCGGTTLPLALDAEVTDFNGWADLAYRMASFARQIEGVQTDILNTHSLLYVNNNFYDNLAPQGFPWGRWVWLADPSNSRPDRPRLITQFAPRPVATLPNADFDEFVGTDADWAAFTLTPAPVNTTVEPDPGDNMNVVHTTLTPGLDPHGNGVYPNIPGIPDVAKIESVVWVGGDPAAVGYDKLPTGWYVDPLRNALVVEGGVPGGEYACEISVRA